MNKKEISEIRKRFKRERSNMKRIYGCYVNAEKEIIAEFSRSFGTMPQEEAERYFSLLARIFGGTQGKNLVDITFKTSQVTDGAEHKLLMDLRNSALEDDELREAFYEKAIAGLSLDGNYLILLGCETYDVPFKNKAGETDADSAEESFTYIVCAVCPVKQSKTGLCYAPEEKDFRDGDITNLATIPLLGFMFPAFDNRATNIYNALMYNRRAEDNYHAFVEGVFGTQVPAAASTQKEQFSELLTDLGEECSMDVVQSVRDDILQRMLLHKESKVPEPLTIGKEDVREVLTSCGVSEEQLAKFAVGFESTFGVDAQLHPSNIVDPKRIHISTPDVEIKVAADRSDLVQTRVIDGVKYILINAQETVTVNGVNIHISGDK